MFKSLFIMFMLLVGMASGQSPVHTPTLEGTYTWSGQDLWTFGQLGFTTTPPQCPTGSVISGFQANFTPNCVSGISYNSAYVNNVGSAGLGSTATKVTLATSTAGYPTNGCGIVDFEIMCYTSLDPDGLSLDGLSRGQYSPTPGTGSAHGAGAFWTSVVAAMGAVNQYPGAVLFGDGTFALNNAHPDQENPGAILEINSGINETYVGANGAIIQLGRNAGQCCNLLAESSIGLTDVLGTPQDLIVAGHNVMQITNPYQTQQPIGFGGGIAGGVVFSQPATIAAPVIADGNPSGSTAYTYLCQDHAGLVPGTAATRNDQASLVFPIGVQCPRQAGVVAYDILRTAGGINQGSIATNVLPGTTVSDNPNSNSASPLAVIGSNTAQTFISGLNYLSAGDLIDLNLTPGTAPLCVGSAGKLTNVGCSGGGGSISFSCSSGVSCSNIGGVETFTGAGTAGSGAVVSANFGAIGGYPATGTNIGAAPNFYSLNPAWSKNQMSGLFSRFTGTNVTSYVITSNVVTMQGINAFNTGDVVCIFGFPTSTFLNAGCQTIIATGLSNTQFEYNFTHANVTSTTESGFASINVPNNISVSGVVFIPPGFIDNPSTAFYNVSSGVAPAAQVADFRKGYWQQQASMYGVKCDAQQNTITLTSGVNTSTVGSIFSSNTQPIGMTMVVGEQVGFGNTGTQNTWAPNITAYNGSVITFSSNAPFSGTYNVVFGTNDQPFLQRAFNDVGPFFPLNIPVCQMLTDTVRWNGASLIGQHLNFTHFYGFPGHDVFQAQDGLPITGWSINTSTGVTTFTVPTYAAHSILAASDYPAGSNLPGDSIQLQNFPTATFFNGQTVNIATHPTPTTFTVVNVFGQSTSSGTDNGVAGPTTSVATNALRVENLSADVNIAIDPSFTWNQYDSNASLTVEPPYYRPLELFGQPANNPFGPAWGQGQINGVAIITQNSAVICVPTASGARQPTVGGGTIIFPYQTGGMITRTVSSTSGSCSTGFTPFTLSSALPNTAGYTSAQAAWFQEATPQTLSVAIPGTITLPYTITVALPLVPVPNFPYNGSSHGHIVIGNGTSSQEWDYMGDTFGGTAGGTATLVLRNGPTTVNGGSGFAIGSVVFPLNPCQAMYHNPYPVIPSINSGNATPVNATYYAGICGGNAAFSLPMADADAWAPFNEPGFSLAHWHDVGSSNVNTNGLGNANSNGSMMLYEAGNYTGYGNTFDDLRGVGLWGGFMQGPASVNQHGVRAVGPTSTGQSINNCTFRTGYAITLTNMNQSAINRCDTYSTEVSPYDGTVVGASTGLFIGYTLSEQDGAGVTDIGQFSVRDWNNEPENGNHDEFPTSVESYGNNVTWIGDIFEGGFNQFGGANQIVRGGQLAPPIFNYGSNNVFEHMYGSSPGYFSQSYTGNGFYNWGLFTQASCSNSSGSTGAAEGPCTIGTVQGYSGHDAFASMLGDPAHPMVNLIGGMLLQGEWAEAGAPLVFDGTETHWGSHIECAFGSINAQCGPYQQFDGSSGYVVIGPFQRLPDAKMVFKLNVKAKNAGSFTFRVLISAGNALSTSCSPNFSLASSTFTATSSGWTSVQMPVDFTGEAGCTLGIQFDTNSAINTLEVGYSNFIPFTGQLYIPLGTHNVGDFCPVAGEISLDANNIWTCQPSSGITFGSGTWQKH